MAEPESKQKYVELVQRGENYVGRPGVCSTRGVRTWQSASVRWLRENLPNSGLDEEVLLVAPPRGLQRERGITATDVKNVQRVLKVLFQARDLLPFLGNAGKQQVPRPENVRKIFVVHGHNDTLKTAVARFLEKLNLEPIILHEQPNLGRTLIEKFIDHSDVAFAVVLLTADDRGGSIKEPSEKYRYRARQNVVLELGYFLGKLGRKNVAAVYQHDVEIPSDYDGVLFIPYDGNGIWQYQLAKEIKAVGIKIDLNRI